MNNLRDKNNIIHSIIKFSEMYDIEREKNFIKCVINKDIISKKTLSLNILLKTPRLKIKIFFPRELLILTKLFLPSIKDKITIRKMKNIFVKIILKTFISYLTVN